MSKNLSVVLRTIISLIVCAGLLLTFSRYFEPIGARAAEGESNPALSPSLPEPWQNTDVGEVKVLGQAIHRVRMFRVDGAGREIGGKQDSFHYAYQIISGDGEIEARITNLQNCDADAKAGIMIREHLNPSSPNVSMLVTPDGDLFFSFRKKDKKKAKSRLINRKTTPNWVKLVRTGKTITAYTSENGLDWKRMTKTNVPFGKDVLVGLAVTSSNDESAATSYFDQVTIEQNNAKGPPAPGVRVTKVMVDPSAVTGGQQSMGGVVLSSPAPNSGVVVSLSSSDTLAATVPDSVTIPKGASSATFPVHTHPVSANRNVAISASAPTGGSKSVDLSVLPPAAELSSVTLNPASVLGGASSQGTVNLNVPAPAGGATVSLFSSNVLVATVPTSIVIPAGAVGASFPVATNSVSSGMLVLISASYGGSTQSAVLAVSAPGVSLSSLALNPTAVTGGNSSHATVTLSAPAPSGGAIVAITSNSSAASVPSSILIPAGDSSGAFTVLTGAVSVDINAMVSATYNGASKSASISISAPSVALIGLNPTSVSGGSQSQGFVNLNAPAPSGGSTVSLSSSNTSVATVPQSVTVPAGSSSAGFNVSTNTVSSTSNVNITASYNGMSRSAGLSVTPPSTSLSTIGLNPTGVTGGNSSQGTVTLTAAAPSGGAVVDLFSSNTSVATVPSSVTVAGGATSATFNVSTTAISSNTSVNISAVFLGVTKTATLSVAATPTASLSAVSLNPTTVTGGTSSQGTVTLSMAAPSGGLSVSLSSSNTSVATVPSAVSVAGGATSATFNVSTNSVSGNTSVTITASHGGISRTASLTVTPVSPSLSALSVSPTSVTGGNSSQGTVTLSSAAPSGGVSISLSSSNTSVATVPSSVTVAAGATSANFAISTSAVSANTSVTISGTRNGVTRSANLSVLAPAPSLTSLSLNPTSVAGGSNSQGTVTLSAAAPTGGISVSLSSSNTSIAIVPSSVSVPAGSTSATFTVSTSQVTVNTSVTISAAYNGTTRGSSLTVQASEAPPQPSGPSFYVAPNGNSSGDGSLGNPWDLQTAMNHPAAVTPGSTIWMRGGRYRGKFTSRLVGTQSAPIRVRSYPGEWAVIDGYKTTTLAVALPNNTSNTPCTFTDLKGFGSGSSIHINNEAMSLQNVSGNSGTCNRVNVTPCEIISEHPVGSTVIMGGNALTILGADAEYRDFEVMHSNPVRLHLNGCNNTQVGPLGRGTGIWHDGPRTRLINLVVHDNDNGIFSTPRAADGEIYGCIVYNNGYEHGGGANTSGHGMYVQNNQTVGFKRIVDTLVFNNFKSGIKAVSQTGPTIGFHFEGVIGFNNASVPHVTSPGRNDGIFVGANDGYADRIVIRNNFLFQPAGTEGGHIGLGYVNDNGSVVVADNYMGGGAQSVNVGIWQSLTFTGNRMYITDTTTTVNRYLATLTNSHGGFTWNNNIYHNLSGRRPFYSGSGTSAKTFQDWRNATGFDSSSSYSELKPPPQIFVRQSVYDHGRANIIVYNWSMSSTVDVDVSSVLNTGDSYELRDAQNFLAGPILTGVYNGQPIRIAMTGLSAAVPIGYTLGASHTAPEFGAFILIRR